MTQESIQTPVTDALVRSGVKFRVLRHAKKALTCEEAAAERGVPLAQMLKCLVLIDKSGRAFLACIPATARLSMPLFKKAVGVKSFGTATDDDILRHTGFTRGSIPPLALPPALTVVADVSVAELPRVNLSSGVATAGIEMDGGDFRTVFNGTFQAICDQPAS